MPFDEEKVVPVGNPPKEHRFDVVSEDESIIIECKCYTWTNGGNVPSAKMSTLNEAVLYLRSINYNARKILAMKKDVRLRTGESLAEYFSLKILTYLWIVTIRIHSYSPILKLI